MRAWKNLDNSYKKFKKPITDVKKTALASLSLLSRSKFKNYDDDYFKVLYNKQILYLAADTGVLANNVCTAEDLRNELTNDKEEKNQNISHLLPNNTEEHKYETSGNDNHETLGDNNDIFFRIIIHKCSRIKTNDISNEQKLSNGKHFALIWFAHNLDHGTLDSLITQLNANQYVCNVVDEKCAYISGNFDALYNTLTDDDDIEIPAFMVHKFEHEARDIDLDNDVSPNSLSNYHRLSDNDGERTAFAFIWGTESYKLDNFHTEISVNREKTKGDIEVTGIIAAFNIRNALLIIMQCLFLFIFTICPPKTCQKQNAKRGQHIAEKVTMDIGAIFIENDVNCRCCRCTCNDFLKRIIAWILSLLICYIVLIGPFLYDGEKTAEQKGCANLLFFDCHGPIIFYSIAVITIIWWSGQEKKYSAPKQHKLLYHEMLSRKQTLMDTYLYAEKSGFFELCEPKHGLICLKPFKSKFGRISRVLWMLLCTVPLFVAQNWEKFWCKVPPFYIEKQELSASTYYIHYSYCILSNLFSLLSVFGFMLLCESMFIRLELYRDNVISLLELITPGNDKQSISLLNKNNLLAWKELQQFVKKKGMILFASLEAPLLSLWILGLFSWIGFFYCVLKVILNDRNANRSLFLNSAFVTWIYLAILTGFETGRMLYWYGLQFSKAAEKIDSAIKKQSVMLNHKHVSLQMIEYNASSKEKQCLMKQVAKLSENMNYDGVIPTAFGWIKFDQLTATAVWSIVLAAIPALYQVIQILLDGMSESKDETGYIFNCNIDIRNSSTSTFNCTKH